MTEEAPKIAGIIAIGNEILTGKVDDLNATYLTKEFYKLGVEVKRVVMIPDEVEVIRDHVRQFSELFDIVVTTGGVGPTHDDVTVESVAAAFDRPLVSSPELEQVIRDFFKDDFKESWLRMALVPEGTELVWRNKLPFPITKFHNVWILPGEPSVLKKKFESIKEDFRQAPIHLHRLYTNLEEGDLADLLREIEEQEGLAVGSYPTYEDRGYKVMVTLESRDRKILAAGAQKLRDGLGAENVLRED